jgi:hypothetical protein
MEQKTIWMRYLQLGVISLILLLCFSCKKHYQSTAEYHFVNNTNYSITFGKGLESYNLVPNGTYKMQYNQDSGKEIDPKNFIPPLIIKSDGGLTFRFNLTKCLDATFYTEHSPLNINNYINEGKIGERTYKFTYTFTEADYNRATVCP